MHEEILIPLGVFAFVTAIVTVVTFGKQFGRHREYAHQERLRAIELGHSPVGSTFWPSLAAIAMGACVPIAALGIAFVANLTHSGGDEAWIFAGIVGVTGIGCGTFLVTRLLGPAFGPPPPVDSGWHASKPALDPDAYDTVGRRG
jgi:hypothetical protein